MSAAARAMTRLAIATGAVLAIGAVSPVQAMTPVDSHQACVHPASHDGARTQGIDREPAGMHVSAADQARIERRMDNRVARSGVAPLAVGAEVPVYFHVMMDKDGNGNVTRQQIVDQVDVLNRTFAGEEAGNAADTGFSFRLAGVNRFRNDTWHHDGASRKYRSETRQGGVDALNIWLVDFKFLGIATFPWEYAKHPKVDGIRVNFDSLPGGSIANFNLGKTATHEAGHWFGLYHTFQGGCKPPGDEVDDTPFQASPTSGCPVGRDTCPAPGTDPIHNYMDYSYDSCYTRFTPGQSVRMNEAWTAYRSGA